MNRERIIFLDLDGVLNSAKFARQVHFLGIVGPSSGKLLIDPRAVAILRRIVESTDCVLVLSSAWRRIYTLDTIRAILEQTGMNKPVPLIDKTPTLNTLRGQEVDQWRRVNAPNAAYVCLDDQAQFLPEQPFVHTNFEVGLTVQDAMRCIEILTRIKEPS